MSGVGSDSFNDVVNSYCFIMGTFTVDRLHGLQVGREVPHPGVGPPEVGDTITYHSYYQWVPFILFVQVRILHTRASFSFQNLHLRGKVCGAISRPKIELITR